MFETLFGEGQYGLKFVLAFIVVLALIGLTAWLVRRFGSERLGTGAARGRQPRLAVIDAASVDGRRRLVLIRRDNVEHLMMIGGPTDVVVEANIVRATASPRDLQPPRAPAAAPDALPRTMPLSEGNMWPLQPEPAPAARVEPQPPRAPQRQTPAPPPLAVEETAEWEEEPEPAPQPPAMPPPLPPQPAPLRRAARAAQEPFIGLADELARIQPQAEPASETRPAGPEARPVRREPRMPRSQPVAPPPQQPGPPPPQAPAPAAEGPPNPPADQNLAEMAQRLEAALRRPAKADGFAEPAPRAAQPTFEPEQLDSEDYVPPPPRAAAPAEARPARSEARPARTDKTTAAPKSSLYDSLEQEMASLLNRPNK